LQISAVTLGDLPTVPPEVELTPRKFPEKDPSIVISHNIELTLPGKYRSFHQSHLLCGEI
jgi:hypothetical protein